MRLDGDRWGVGWGAGSGEGDPSREDPGERGGSPEQTLGSDSCPTFLRSLHDSGHWTRQAACTPSWRQSLLDAVGRTDRRRDTSKEPMLERLRRSSLCDSLEKAQLRDHGRGGRLSGSRGEGRTVDHEV